MICCDDTDHADIELEDGESVILGFYIENPDGTPVDLTGQSVNLVWSADGQAVGSVAAPVVDGAAGYVEVQFDPAAMGLQRDVSYAAKFVDEANPKQRHPQGASLTMRLQRRT